VVEVTPLSSLETPHSREDLPRNRRDATALLSSTCSGYTISSSDPLKYTLKSIIGGTKYLPSISSACRFPVNMAFDTSLICGGVPAGALQLPVLDTRLFRGWISTCALFCGWISTCALICGEFSIPTLEFSAAIMSSSLSRRR